MSTEQKIKEAARIEFIKKGLAGARMQEIADTAGINKAMLHYYYRSKEKLFQTIFDEVIIENGPKIIGILGAELPLSDKIEAYVDQYLDLLMKNPFVPMFLFNEIKNHPDKLLNQFGLKAKPHLVNLSRQLASESKSGKIRPIPVAHFIANLVGMCVMPFIAQPMIQGVFGMDDATFKTFILERKKVIPQFVMNAITINQ